ncbi:MAG: TrkA C-terminal domain-containing protein [Smithellaceae bacterium]|nr:TrkA C-terminal domain-containing protein [Smithellaceae bacterium]
MGSVVVLLIIVVASLICVRAGAIALELTGMKKEKAKFQALSAFTNTGFTTRETEEITNIPIRRKIVTVLIILGHAGTVSVIAAFATSLLQRDTVQMALNIGIIIVSLYGVYRLALWRGLTARMGQSFSSWLGKRYGLSAPSLEEMLSVAEGVGVVRLTITEGTPLIDRPLSELGLKARKVQILSIIRGGEVITVPQGHDSLKVGDTVICYGDMKTAKELFNASGLQDKS